MSTLKVNTIQSNTTSELDINSPLGTVPSLDVINSVTVGGNINAVGVITATSIVATTGTFSGNVSIGGTLTYEDVTNIDSVGIITARSGVRVNSGGLVVTSGVSTFTNIVVSAGSTSAPSISPSGDSNTGIFFPSADTVAIAEGGVEALRVDSSGNLGIGTNSSFAKTHIEINAAAGAGSGSAAALWLRNSNQTANNSATIFAGNNSSQASAAINFIHQNYSTNAGAITFDTRTDSSTYAERVRIDSSGRVTMPYQPSFSVWYSGSQSIPHNTPTKVQFNVEVFDVGGNFDISTNYRFTAPVAGKYLFMGHLYIYSTYQAEVFTYKNGSQYKRFSGPLGSGGNDNPNGMDFLDVIDLAVNDYVEIYGFQSRTGDTASQLIYGGGLKETSFVGYLIG